MSKASQLRQRAQDFLQKGKSDKAIEEYKKLVQLEPRNPNLYNELGDIYLRINDRIQAVASFENATTNYEKVALYNNAVAVCKKILRVVPNRLDTIFKLGEIKAKQKFTGEAESYFLQYFEAILADPDSSPQQAEERTAKVLELLPGCEALMTKACDVYEHIGLKSKAANVLADYISKNGISGDPQKLNYYRNKLDLLKQALNRLEREKIEKIIESAASKAPDAPAGNAPGDGQPDESAAKPAGKGVDSAGINLTDYASSMGGGAGKEAAPAQPAEQAGHAEAAQEPEAKPSAEEDGSIDSAGTVDETAQSPEEPAAAASDGTGGTAAEERVLEEKLPDEVEAESAGAPHGEPGDDSSGSADHPEAAAVEDEDLSELLEKEDARCEDETSPRSLVEEITSDVEENDYKSHYDLGMAYIEMGLYNDAIKELQISSRSENLQLQSLEMIGLCFLSLENPRLAVKQLERGLEVAKQSGGDSLGIHYNLGLAYEALGEMDRARENYEEVYIVDVTFRDVSDKMKKFSTVS